MSAASTERLARWVRAGKIVGYVQARQNEDGGYSFAQGAESSAADTYYGIEVLRMLGVRPLNSDKTIDFVGRLQHEDGSFDSVYVAYYVVMVSHELGARPRLPFERFVLSLRRPHGGFGGLEADIESPSELEQTFLSLKLLRLVEHKLSLQKTKDLILSLQNPDGSFGRSGYSRLGATYHALVSLDLLGFNVRTLRRTADWVRSCEIPSGGFRATPDSYDPYIVIDDLYYGVVSLDVVGEECRYPSQTLDLLARFQNANGGFVDPYS